MGKAENHSSQSNVRQPSDTREFKTNIPALDRLLGYNENLKGGTGIRPGDIIVLRGGPGSGKTTLGLQIMSNYLASDDCRYAGGKFAAVFLSLETEAERMFTKVKKDFGFFPKRQDRLLLYRLSEINHLVRKLGRKYSAASASNLERGILKATVKESMGALAGGAIGGLAGAAAVRLIARVTEEPAKEVVAPMANRLANFFMSLAKNRKAKPPKKDGVGGVLFIDSINALLAMARQWHRGGEWEPRVVLKAACESMKSTFGDFVIIASSEFHHETSWVPAGISESFLSDVEILLTNEPIAVPAGYEASRQGSVGYNIFKIIEKVQGEEGTKLESRSFIRVLKSRKGANQSRRCAYDIMTGTGLQFYETYPGDGHILLFTENPKQKQVWDTFFGEELPQLYPALRYEDFDRGSLQRTFLNQRRFRYVPSRTDMYVSSFDNYWINWYGELCWRRAVGESIEQAIKITEKNRTEVARLVGAIHRSLMADAGPLLKNPPDVNENDSIYEVLIAFAAVLRNDDCRKCFLCRSYWRLLKEIPNEQEDAFKKAFTYMVGTDKSQEANRDKSKSTREIKDILDKMWKLVADKCCENSPIRRFFEGLKKTPKPDDVKNLMQKVHKAAYKSPEVGGVELTAKTEAIHRLLKTPSKALFSEMSNKVDEVIRKSIRSHRIRERLTHELLDCGIYEEGRRREEIKAILQRYLEDEGGCECRAQLWRYLWGARLKKIGAGEEKFSEEKLNEERSLLLRQMDEIVGRLFGGLPSMLLGIDNQGNARAGSVLEMWLNLTKEEPYYARFDLIATYCVILEKRNKYRLLTDIPDERLRLFGERRSPIIDELEGTSPENKRPIHRHGLLFSLRDNKSMISIPYNANIGFMVYRHDLISEFIKKHVWKDDGPQDAFDAYVEGVLRQYSNQPRCIEGTLFQGFQLSDDQKKTVQDLVKNNVEAYAKHAKKGQRFPQGPLQTWEELIVLLELMDKLDPLKKKDRVKQHRHFVIETQTLDTLLCTILEFLWSCGGNLRINPDYSIEDEIHTKERLFQALYLLGIMLNKRIITEDSTLDAAHFANRYNEPRRAKDYDGSKGWVFARQWYSTLVDLLTARREPPKREPEQHESASRDDPVRTEIPELAFLWRNKEAQLGIMPIPISLSYYLEFRANGQKAEDMEHISCWGDWHWVMTRGTENTELGIDIINSLMASQKICDRAFQCAAVPTVKEFYEQYGDSRCLSLPERRYYWPEMLPNTSFKELQETYFKHTRSRSQIFDYEHCMLELYSLFQSVKSQAGKETPDWSHLESRIEGTFKKIKELGERTLLRV